MNPSFADYLRDIKAPLPSVEVGSHDVPHGTTIVGIRGGFGALLAGDRRATMGNVIAQRNIEKVFPADDFSIIGIAGTAGLALELVRLFQVELEHYEKIEGTSLTLDGKANRLSALLRGNLGMAMQGLAIVPMFGGYDLQAHRGRIFSYDITGGRYEEHDYYAVGSGSSFAKGSLKKLYSPDCDESSALRMALEALYDAAEDDSATGGPDVARGIYPVVAIARPQGVVQVPQDTIAAAVHVLIEERRQRPDGPLARGGGA